MLSRMNHKLARWSSQQAGSSLKAKLETLIPKKKEQLVRIKKELGDKVRPTNPGTRQGVCRCYRGWHARS